MPKQVMIVEDNELNMKLFRDLIEASGYTTIQTRNGMEALDLARKYRPDLILMDICMPHLDGYQATERLKADPALRDIPVVALSAHAMPHEKARALQAGCVAHIEKPIEVASFIAQLLPWLPPGAAAKPAGDAAQSTDA